MSALSAATPLMGFMAGYDLADARLVRRPPLAAIVGLHIGLALGEDARVQREWELQWS